MKKRLICSNCGGIKFIGDPYYAYGTYYVDVTCVVCADSKDIELEKLKAFLHVLEKGQSDNKKTNS